MDIKSFENFLLVVEMGSLRAASEEIGISQPALTKMVRRLEDGFGVSLLHRNSRGVEPTVFGLALVRHARDIQASMQAARNEASAFSRGHSGFVRIGMGPSWQATILPAALRDIARANPSIAVTIRGGPGSHLEGLLKRGQIDFMLAAVPHMQTPDPELEWHVLLEDRYTVIADRSHPFVDKDKLTTSKLLQYRWVLPPKSSNMMERFSHFLRMKNLPIPTQAFETDIIDFKFALVKDSDYLALHANSAVQVGLPDFIRPLHVADMDLVRLGGILLRKDVPQTPTAKFFLTSIIDICAQSQSR